MGRKFTIFALFYFEFEGKFQVQAPRGAYIGRGNLTEVFCVTILGSSYLEGPIHVFTSLASLPYPKTKEKQKGSEIKN